MRESLQLLGLYPPRQNAFVRVVTTVVKAVTASRHCDVVLRMLETRPCFSYNQL
jgi:hypothetical protein